MPKTKIICTIGPASESSEVLRAMILEGMNVARLNFSHGTHEEHAQKISTIRRLSEELERPVAILQDLCGPKIRLGKIPDPGIELEPGQEFILTSQIITGSVQRVSVTYSDLPKDVKAGDRLLLADGMMELIVQRIDETEIFCEVFIGGRLTSGKGINLPTGTITAPALTEKDIADLAFGLDHGVDFVALSFVKKSADILQAKRFIEAHGSDTPVIAKIEKHEALDDFDAILDVSDGIMVARGDLGVEIPLENVPNIQKKLIRAANIKGKPVIIATQMLRSMVDAPRPTRAEANDVSNGVLDGADAVMLSEETASGKYPVESLRYMGRIATQTELRYPHGKYIQLADRDGVAPSVSYSACILANDLDASAVVATSRSGLTAMLVARFRPKTKIIALSPDWRTIRRLCLYWGCIPCHLNISHDTDEMIERAAESALSTGYVHKGETVVITAGRPLYKAGTTNMLWVKQL